MTLEIKSQQVKSKSSMENFTSRIEHEENRASVLKKNKVGELDHPVKNNDYIN